MEDLYINVNNKNSKKDKTILNNHIDKEVQGIFRPLNLMQILVLNPKHHIKNNAIYPNNCFNKFILTFGFVIFLTTYIYRALEIILDDNSINFVLFASIFNICYRCMGFIMNFIANFTQTHKSILFVLHFQEVHRFLNNESRLKRFIMRSWMSVAALFGFYIFIFIYVHKLFFKPPWNAMLFVIISASLDANSIFAMRIMKLLTDKAELWNAKILFAQVTHTQNVCRQQQLQITKLFQAYVKLLNCYKIFVSIYQQAMLFQTVETFSHGLLHVQFLIVFFKGRKSNEGYENPAVALYVSFLIVKNLVIQVLLSLHLEAFYEALKCAQNSCEVILVSNCTVVQKKLCKNVLRVQRASFSKMSVCGLFYIDINHLIHLLALLTHYIIVLLQFDFL